VAELAVIVASRIVTQNGDDTEAMAVSQGRVLATGTVSEMRALAPAAELSDYSGATIIPGFNDAHQHLTMMAAQSLGLDLSEERIDTPQRLTRSIREYSQFVPPQRWVVATRYDHVRSSGGQRLTRSDLDKMVPDRPVIVVNIGAHWGVANSAALDRGGLDDRSPSPPGGEIGKDPAGHLNGFLSEQALFDFIYPSLASRDPVVPPPETEDMALSVVNAARKLLASGITSVGDAMVGPRELNVLQRARQLGLPLRVNALLTFPHLPRLTELGLHTDWGDEWLRLGGIKAFVDGAVAGRSCAVAEPFEGTDDRGIVTTSPAELQELVDSAAAARIRMAIHANGERAIEMVLDAFENARVEYGEDQPRHRIEHCSIITPQILSRLAKLRVITVPFGNYAYYHGDKLVDWYGQDRLERMFAHRSMLDAGLTVAGSSDYPCGPWEPLLGLQSCVTRRSVTGRPVGLSQRITLREALRIYTVGSAEASDEHIVKGRLAQGYLADFVVLDGDLLDVPEHRIADVPVLATWVHGRCVWTAA
jgi:predicted amidohydrolase YtcJ